MTERGNLPALTEQDGLSRYLAEIREYPMLSPEEEYMLAKRWHEHGDRDAAHKLVTSHLRLVAKLAMGLVALHVVAALYHQFVLRDGLLGRMRPGRGA